MYGVFEEEITISIPSGAIKRARGSFSVPLWLNFNSFWCD